MRLWLGAAFATVGLITAASVYLFVVDSSGTTLSEQSADIAVGRTARTADQLGSVSPTEGVDVLLSALSENFDVWAVNAKGRPFGGAPSSTSGIETIPRRKEAIKEALDGRRFAVSLGGDVTVASAPIYGESKVNGAVVSHSTPPPALERAIDDLRGDSLRALGIAIAAGILVGFVASSLISIRIKRLARSAEQMAGGRLDVPLPQGGGDEIADLTGALDTMQLALRESFDMLATERDRLSAILDGLDEAVLVVGVEGQVRFSNPAAKPLISAGQPAAAMIPFLRRAAERGAASNPYMTVDDRVFALQARHVPAEEAVLVVVRDRTEELRRELAEREFVSNAAHELRNPLAGISGAIEVLRGGAKDDPDAREHFLSRLADDADRMSRLTQSLLTLARVEAVGQREKAEVVDVNLAVAEAAGAVSPPDDILLETDAEPDVVAEGDPVLLREVLVGLLTNACKNTPAPGTVTLRVRRGEEREVMIEVEDTGKGIPAAEQDRVFERFYRGTDARDSDGFGLGLAIAKRMVDIMGGEIGVRSRRGHGSTFWVRLREPEPTPTPVA